MAHSFSLNVSKTVVLYETIGWYWVCS